jgi:predicted  nucleic acid-binding Zn-ribbon protein
MTENKINLAEQIKLLVELQGLDTHIFRVQDELEQIPVDIKKIEDEFKQVSADLKTAEDGMKALQLKRKEKEMDLESKEGNVRKLQTQLFQLKTNKEYSTMQDEISRAKADSSLIEEDIIRILEQMDLQNAQISKEKDLLKAEDAKYSDMKNKKALESKKIEADLGVVKTQREELAGKIDKTVLSKYEKIVHNKGGLAVVPILSNSCQGCFQVLPPQILNIVKMRADIVLCENCSRILYFED